MSEKLTGREKAEIVIQTDLQAVPYVGSSIASAYFATKQEKRFKRLEAFYRELANRVSTLEVICFFSHTQNVRFLLMTRCQRCS